MLALIVNKIWTCDLCVSTLCLCAYLLMYISVSNSLTVLCFFLEESSRHVLRLKLSELTVVGVVEGANLTICFSSSLDILQAIRRIFGHIKEKVEKPWLICSVPVYHNAEKGYSSWVFSAVLQLLLLNVEYILLIRRNSVMADLAYERTGHLFKRNRTFWHNT